jgi:3-oxoacyl-[acyl-carrier-protein] synthase-3
MPNWYKCINESLRKSQITREEFSKDGFLAILHMKRSGHVSLLNDLGLKKEQSIYLENYGHIGQIDQILSLHLALESKQVKEGTIVCMLAAGIGYVWAANIVRWG